MNNKNRNITENIILDGHMNIVHISEFYEKLTRLLKENKCLNLSFNEDFTADLTFLQVAAVLEKYSELNGGCLRIQKPVPEQIKIIFNNTGFSLLKEMISI